MFYIVLCSGIVIGFTSVAIWKVAKEIHKGDISSSGFTDIIDNIDVIIRKEDD